VRRLVEVLARSASVLRRVIGAPDYERYLTHARLAHPGLRPLTYDEFVRDTMARRYGSGAGRCC
jgi:uncharacterized short protein YbdD (DUF466 family)